jgi:glutamate dehydrogenase (NAD(P)+)
VTGKPVDMGGSLGRREATARGCLFATRRALERSVLPGLSGLKGARVAVQGFGNAGSIAAELFTQAGAAVVAVSDSRGGVFRARGLDLAAVLAHKAATGSVAGTPGTEPLGNAELLALECDLLIPAALEAQIRADNVEGVRARMIVEAANGPVTPAADHALFARGVPVLPDILANAGGVTVSYFEWVQNIENEKWDEAEVNGKLQTKMERAANAVVGKQAAVNEQAKAGTLRSSAGAALGPVDLRTAALIVAIDRVAAVALERGIWP